MKNNTFIAASSLGAAFTMPVCGFLISYLGWESVFYFTGELCSKLSQFKNNTCTDFSGGIGFIWSVLWFTIIYDTPAKHPRITEEERHEIETAIGSTTSKSKPKSVPWKAILTAPPVWTFSRI